MNKDRITSSRRAKLYFRLSMVLTVLTTNPSALFAAGTGKINHEIPQSWYSMPEDSQVDQAVDFNVHTPSFKSNDFDDLAEAIDYTIDSNTQALDHAVESERFIETETHRVKGIGAEAWHISNFAVDLGLSAQGLMGIMFIKGSALINVYWQRLMQNDKAVDSEESSRGENLNLADQDNTLTFTRPLTNAELTAKVLPIVDAVMATGKVKSRQNLTKNLMATAERFQSMMVGVMDDPDTEWWPNRLRLDVNVGASGVVGPAVTVGGDLRLRFDWFPNDAKATIDHQNIAYNQEIADNLNEFLGQLAEVLAQVDFDEFPSPDQLALQSVRMAFGVFGTIDFGVAKGDASVEGSAYFVRRPAHNSRYHFDVSKSDRLPIIEINPDASHLRYAKRHGIPYETRRNPDTGIVEARYRPLLSTFLAGLHFASGLGSSIVNRINERPIHNWQVQQLRSQFGLSLGGWTPVATIGASASLQLIYNR